MPNTPQESLLSLQLIKTAMDSTNEGVTIVDLTQLNQPLIYVNKAFEKLTGYPREEILGKNCNFLQGNQRNQQEVALIRQVINNRTSCRIIIKNFKKDGTLFWNELSLAPLTDPNNPGRFYVGIQRDVSKEISQKETIQYLLEHDDLTRLYNYRGFFNHVSRLIHSFKGSALHFGIGVADIDFFAKINDRFGHLHGNNILRLLADQFFSQFNKSHLISRLGGDEFFFAIIQPDSNIDWFHTKIQQCLHEVNKGLAENSRVSLSTGYILEKCDQPFQLDHMLCRADELMHKNKQANHLLYYTNDSKE